MRIEYDPSVDAAFLYLREVQPGEIRRTEDFVVNGPSGVQEISLGFTNAGELLRIEFLDAAQILPAGLLKGLAQLVDAIVAEMDGP